MKITTHLKTVAGFSACGLGNPIGSDSTMEIERVTCRKCLQSLAAKERGCCPSVRPGPKPHGDSPKAKITIRIDADLLEQLQKEENRSAVVEQALLEYYKLRTLPRRI
ncbi:hypothetical protein S7335_1244 [Synechococcus sp. PCC 7335]|uniref:hypothetical protein n=1 Tax=Synechococcus sp. (strain ATCC 29403 / PCC 7335) TaxID=91464 RepID=UPI00017EE128|nr:hypothetical protein [Synechococcus sp. PCC 7335]EDX82464.1 hypothetical protein S7335_1168 [Synechococcus sp. PCC 7335]EDX82540.1 hypothetical protein S7335_1244 [Synechococcus sp. PCC 7335]